MALSGIINSLLSSIESLADTTADAADSKFRMITRIAVALIAAIVFLIIFALDSTLAIVMLALGILAVYLLGIDIGFGGDSDSGPRQ